MAAGKTTLEARLLRPVIDRMQKRAAEIREQNPCAARVLGLIADDLETDLAEIEAADRASAPDEGAKK